MPKAMQIELVVDDFSRVVNDLGSYGRQVTRAARELSSASISSHFDQHSQALRLGGSAMLTHAMALKAFVGVGLPAPTGGTPAPTGSYDTLSRALLLHALALHQVIPALDAHQVALLQHAKVMQDHIQALGRAQSQSQQPAQQPSPSQHALIPRQSPLSTRAPAGPGQRLAEVQRRQQYAVTPAERADAQLAVLRAQRAVTHGQREVANAGQPQWMKTLNTFVRSTRFSLPGTNNAAMPLVGRTLDLLGLGGPEGMALVAAIGIATMAITGMAEATKAATQGLKEMAEAGTQSGGQPRDVAQLVALGVPAGQIAAMAAQARERAVNDPWARMERSRMGLAFPGLRQFGEQNEAKVLREEMNALHEMGRAASETADPLRKEALLQDQLRAARMLGLEGMLDEIRVSEKVWKAQKRDATLREQVANPAAQQAARDAMAEWRRVGLNFATLMQSFSPALAPITDGFRVLSGAIADVTRILQENPAVVQAFGMAVRDVIIAGAALVEAVGLVANGFQEAVLRLSLVMQTLEMMRQGKSDKEIKEWQQTALSAIEMMREAQRLQRRSEFDRLETALEHNTRAQEDGNRLMREGQRGGGQRAGGAVSDAMTGSYLEDALRTNALRMGALTYTG
jgi:hypothetical protein